MAWTQNDIDALDAQYGGPGGGVKKIRFADGRERELFDPDSYMRLRALMTSEVNSGTAYPSSRTSIASFSKD